MCIRDRFRAYFKGTAAFIVKTEEVLRQVLNDSFCSQSRETLQKINEALYEDILPEHYKKSYANPDYACITLGEEYGTLLSMLYAELRRDVYKRQASLSGDHRSLNDLTIVWNETVNDANGAVDHGILKAAKLRYATNTYTLSAPLELAELPDRTLADHFDAYVSGTNQVQAAIQATRYDDKNPEVIGGVTVPGEETILYTATSNFITDAVAVEDVYKRQKRYHRNSGGRPQLGASRRLIQILSAIPNLRQHQV